MAGEQGFDAAPDTVPVNAIRACGARCAGVGASRTETARAWALPTESYLAGSHKSSPTEEGPPALIGCIDKDHCCARREDAASASKTQEGGLYAEVKPMFLRDGEADKGGIFDAFRR
jgi:hypothetical protein